MSAALIAAARRNRLPASVDWSDVVVLGFATHKLARILTKDAVTSVIRAPFVRLDQKSGSNTFEERARVGAACADTVGELLSCPECTGQWVVGGLAAGLLHAPRATRAIAGMYTALDDRRFPAYGFAAMKRRA